MLNCYRLIFFMLEMVVLCTGKCFADDEAEEEQKKKKTVLVSKEKEPEEVETPPDLGKFLFPVYVWRTCGAVSGEFFKSN